ncbi:hypothetical protein GCM10022224_055490 [Nonomuraea antimicrobica]|uniref:Secreted protein n=1 Tax=Nonomuraea antimicrobica TaxID=561173 RepID=A0ABP7CC93_9ACTN
MSLGTKIKALACAGATALALIATPGTAHAGTAGAQMDVSESSFYVSYGNTVVRGSVKWGSGYSATITGSLKAASNGRIACVQGYTGRWTYETSEWCTRQLLAGQSESFNWTLNLPYAGGVQHLYVRLRATEVSNDWDDMVVGADYCNRDSIYCSNG